jgi:hypothetical protein
VFEFGPREGVDDKIIGRMNDLAAVLGTVSEINDDENGDDAGDKLVELEALLRRFEEEEIPPELFAPVQLDDPLLLLLAQHRSFRICRREFFCPDERCRSAREITSIGRLTNHMQLEHGASKEDTADMIRYFISRLLPGQIRAEISQSDGQLVELRLNFGRCHCPGCEYVSGIPSRVDVHIRRVHKSLDNDIKSIGWFWGPVHAMIKTNPRTSIAEAMGEGAFWKCQSPRCHQAFQSPSAIRLHFSQMHASSTVQGWEPHMRCLNLKWVTNHDTIEDVQHGGQEGRRRGGTSRKQRKIDQEGTVARDDGTVSTSDESTETRPQSSDL